MLKDIKLEENFDFDLLAERTELMSGSDLKELCRNAAMIPVRDYVRKAVEDKRDLADVDGDVCLSF
jgi:SpoVK/Ycf46/Vps4 family AAA+-type ATPase